MTANNRKPWPGARTKMAGDEHLLINRNGKTGLLMQVQDGKAVVVEVAGPMNDDQLVCEMASRLKAGYLGGEIRLPSDKEIVEQAMSLVAHAIVARRNGAMKEMLVKAARAYGDPRDNEDPPTKPNIALTE